MNDHPNLGPCCGCGTREGVINILLLGRRGPVPGKGWGCVQCGLPPDGAVAVFCHACVKAYTAGDETVLRFVCRGYPAAGERVPIGELPPEEFDHDPAKHPEA